MSSVSSNSSTSTLMNVDDANVFKQHGLRSSIDTYPSPSQISQTSRENAELQESSESEKRMDLSETISSPYATFYDAYFVALTSFAFEKARELVDKQQRDLSAGSQAGSYSPGHSAASTKINPWLVLMSSLSTFATNEKGYMSLSFLAPKGFLRKDSNLKSSMLYIRNDMKKLANLLPEQEYLRTEILSMVNVRLDLMEFYEKLSILGTAKNVEIEDLLSDIEVVGERFEVEKRNCRKTTTHFFTAVKWEMDALTSLLKAHSCLTNWEFLQSLISLQCGNQLLQEWQNHIQGIEVSKKSTFYSFTPTTPILVQWIGKFKSALLSKFSFYFYEILMKSSYEANGMKSICGKLQHDFHLRLQNFQKKMDAVACCLILDSRGSHFHASGYLPPYRKTSVPQGLDSFPAILSIPSKPSSHWPTIIMLLSDRLHDLNAEKFVGFYDQNLQATFYLQRVDVKVYLSVVCDSKKSEKDNYTAKFLQELAQDLKFGKVFSSLKLLAK